MIEGEEGRGEMLGEGELEYWSTYCGLNHCDRRIWLLHTSLRSRAGLTSMGAWNSMVQKGVHSWLVHCPEKTRRGVSIRMGGGWKRYVRKFGQGWRVTALTLSGKSLTSEKCPGLEGASPRRVRWRQSCKCISKSGREWKLGC